MPCLIQSKGFLTACRKTAAHCIICLTVWNLKIPSVYRVSLSFCFNDEGKQAVKTKAECFKAWRRFYFHHYTFQIRVTDQAWGQWQDIWPNSLFAFCVPRRSRGQWKIRMTPISSYLDRKRWVNRIYFMVKLSWFLFTTVCLTVDLLFKE